MKSLTVLAAALACVLSLSACNSTANEDVYNTMPAPETAYSDDSSESSITDISIPELNIAT